MLISHATIEWTAWAMPTIIFVRPYGQNYNEYSNVTANSSFSQNEIVLCKCTEEYLLFLCISFREGLIFWAYF